ncbi:MAG: Crp/Fnr family transcriptional regulator [Chloroflexi bacterium]|nr:Crp/Fnr family transcriptional regulator [Chloroflexota bacterium]
MRKMLPWHKGGREGSLKRPVAPVAEYLQRVDILKGLSMEELEMLFHGVMIRETTPGTVFFTPEDLSERLFILKEGQVEVYRLTLDGRRLVTRRIGPGRVFGEMGLLGQTMEGCFAEAIEPSLVCSASREDILRLIRERPEVALRLLETVTNHLRTVEERLQQVVFSPVKVRLATFLLANADPPTGVLAGYTHADIGDAIGALRQTVTETLNQMQGQGLVEIAHKHIRVKEPQRLKALAEER